MADDPNNPITPEPTSPIGQPPATDPAPQLTATDIATAVADAMGPKFDALFSIARGKGGKEEAPPKSEPQAPEAKPDSSEGLRREFHFYRQLDQLNLPDQQRSVLERLYQADQPEDPVAWLKQEADATAPAQPAQPSTPDNPGPLGADAPAETSASILTWTHADYDRHFQENAKDPGNPMSIENRSYYESIKKMAEGALRGKKLSILPQG